MSLWLSVTNSPSNGVYKMKAFYDRKSMFEIRVTYAAWIEERLGNREIDRYEQFAIQFFNDLKGHIITTSSEMEASLMLSRMTISPLEFYNHLTDGMAMEFLISELTPTRPMHQLNSIQMLIRSCNEFYQIPNLNLEPENNQIINEMNDPVTYLTEFFIEFDHCQRSVFEELNIWKIQQIQNCNEEIPQKDNPNQIQMNEETNKLNQIQTCIELLIEVTFRLLQLIDSVKIRRMRNQRSPDERLEQLIREIRIKQENLMLDSFIVENQPNQVIKTNTNFSASVRWLVGPQLGLNNKISNVKCMFVSETVARRLNKERQTIDSIKPSSKEISGDQVKMEYQENNRVYSANFKSINLKKIQRSDRRGSSESVMDEKFALLFQMTVVINNSSFIISTLSMPVVVIVHGNQEHQACATIMWDNAFGEVGRDLFVVPDRVSWERLSDALYWKCISETKRGFTDTNKCFLYEKFFSNCNMIPQAEVTWTRFCKDELPGFSFTFWDWFYHTMKLIKERLLEYWNEHLIEGFISKAVTAEKLKFQPPGTFLLRFSDSIKGAITISYVNKFNKVDHIQPWTIKDLQNRCLADRIRDLVDLTNLYPSGINKTDLFEKFCTQDDQKVSVGYVPGIPITTIVRNDLPRKNEITGTHTPLENLPPEEAITMFEDMSVEENNCYDYEFDYNLI